MIIILHWECNMARLTDTQAQEIFASNLKRIMDEQQLDAPKLAAMIDLEKQSIYAWLKMKSFPSTANLQKLIEKLGVTSDDLLTNRGARKPSKYVSVPLLGRIGAGDPLPMDSYDDVREAPEIFKESDDQVFLLRVEGDSVNKIIPDGSFALISPKFREPNEHDLFAVCVNGYDATVKHVKKLANGFMLIPDSHDPTYRPKVFDYNDETTDEVTIIGKVVWWCAEY